MFRDYDASDGTPAHVYRAIGEIREEIREVVEKIREAKRMLNMRELLLDFIDRARDYECEPSVWIPELEGTVEAARESYSELCDLKEQLSDLKEELSDTKCAFGY